MQKLSWSLYETLFHSASSERVYISQLWTSYFPAAQIRHYETVWLSVYSNRSSIICHGINTEFLPRLQCIFNAIFMFRHSCCQSSRLYTMCSISHVTALWKLETFTLQHKFQIVTKTVSNYLYLIQSILPHTVRKPWESHEIDNLPSEITWAFCFEEFTHMFLKLWVSYGLAFPLEGNVVLFSGWLYVLIWELQRLQSL